MRSIKPVAALATAAVSLALAAAGASAAKHASPNGRCNVNLNVAPRQITTGDSVVAFGRLRCRGRSPLGAATVTLLQHASGTPGFSVVQTTTTDARGFYEFTPAGVAVNSVFYVRSHGAASGRRTVKVAAQVTLAGPPEGTQLFTGASNKVTFTGTVSPADAGARVVLQRQNAATGNEWRRIDLGRVSPAGSYSITHTFVVPGDANIRAFVRSQRRNSPSPSNVLTYEISQAQNPGLTIEASADPISYGQSVTISGAVVGAPKVPVTLLARTRRQHGFAPVAEVMTDPSGNYAFPAQSPVDSTLYEVKGAGKLSAVLYEGVKDVLTAQVSQSAVQAGQALTFSGTVAPDHTGHVIYLERQNASGMGFHVVQVGTVSAGSVYSIVHTVYDPGTKVFRVKIPGGPENEGAASPAFTIVVTPAPAARADAGSAGQLLAARRRQVLEILRASETPPPDGCCGHPWVATVAPTGTSTPQAQRAASCSGGHRAGLQVRTDLALDPLQRVVYRLRVAHQPLADLLIGVAVQIQRQHAALELGQRTREAPHQRAQLLRGDHLVDRVVHGRAGQHLVERGHVLASPGRRGGEGDVLVQRRVLVAGGGLHRRDDLPRDAQLGEVAKARLAVGAKVADRLIQAEEPLLDEIVGVAPGEEVGGGLQAHEAVVALDEPVVCVAVALLRKGDQEAIFNPRFRVRVMRDSCHEQILS